MWATGKACCVRALHLDLCFVVSVSEWLATFENKLVPYLNLMEVVDEEMAGKLGKKDPQEYPWECGWEQGQGY